MELYQKTKQSSTPEDRQFARDHDRVIYEDYYSAMVEKYGEDVTSWPPLDTEAWMRATNTLSQQHPKPYIYGFGASRDVSQFFPGRHGSQSQSQTPFGAPPSQASWNTPEFRTFLREQVIIINQELQRSGTHGVPSFTPGSSAKPVHDDDDSDGDGGDGDGGGEGRGYVGGDDDIYREKGIN